MADSTIKGLTELETLKENDLLIAWKEGAPANQTKKITAVNARKFLIIEAVCDSAADATTKEVVIDANAIPERIAVTFTHGNTAGDTTQQGFTPLTLSIAYNGGSADFEICDSLGNYAGKGFGGGVDGGIIILQLLSTKALITNSDIRQKDANYTIKSDGSFVYSVRYSIPSQEWVQNTRYDFYSTMPDFIIGNKITQACSSSYNAWAGYTEVSGFTEQGRYRLSVTRTASDLTSGITVIISISGTL